MMLPRLLMSWIGAFLTLLGLLLLAAIPLAFATTHRSLGPVEASQSQGAGTTTVALSNSDGEPLVSVSNPSKVVMNDIRFRMSPASPGVKTGTGETQMTNAQGTDMKWDFTSLGLGAYSGVVGSGGSDIPPGGGGGLQLLSIAGSQSGWDSITYTRTRDGKSIYQSLNLDGDANPSGTMLTGNLPPVLPNAIVHFTNVGTLAIVDVTLSIDNDQVFEGIGSDDPGVGAVDTGANTATFYFDNAIEPGEESILYWDYTGLSANENDALVTFTVGTSGLMLQSSGGLRFVREGRTSFRIPLLRLKEVAIGSLGDKVLLVSDGTYSFGSPQGTAAVVSGTSRLGEPSVNATGEVEIPVVMRGSTISVVEVKDLLVTSTEAGGGVKGQVHLFVKSKGTSRLRVPIGYRR